MLPIEISSESWDVKNLLNLEHETADVHTIGKKPVVTLGMCMRNSERQVVDAIRSITDQDFPHDLIEAIFVDDGSEDRTLSVVNSWMSKTDIRTKVFSYGWRGVAKSRNTIFKNANGDFIMWIDSDEIFPKSFVREQVEFMKKNPQFGIAIGLPWILPEWSMVLSLEILTVVVSNKQATKPRNLIWKTEKLPGIGASIFRTDALKKVNGFDERLNSVGEDIDIAYRIVKAGWQIGWDSSVFYETHGGMSTLAQLWKKYFMSGYGLQKVYLRNRNYFSLVRISPIGSLIAGVLYATAAYKSTYMKMSFLIPFHFTFKMLAWFAGFMQSQIHG